MEGKTGNRVDCSKEWLFERDCGYLDIFFYLNGLHCAVRKEWARVEVDEKQRNVREETVRKEMRIRMSYYN